MKHTQKIINADCRVGIKELKKNSVSLILTDPPYFIDGMGSDWDRANLNKKKSKAGVIGSMPVGMKFSPNQSKELKGFLEPIAEEWLRVIKPAGFVLCFMQPRLAHAAATAIENAGFHIKDMYFWKRFGQPKAFTHTHFIKKRKDLTKKQKEELIESLGGRKTPQLRPDAEVIIMAQAPYKGTLVDNWEKYKTGFVDVLNPFLNVDKFPSTIIECKKPTKRYEHITAKPVPLLRHLVRIFCEPNGFVLDPFSGCGSTGEACLLENYAFLGFEIDKSYFQIAKNRIFQNDKTKRRAVKDRLQKSREVSQRSLI